MSQHPSNRITEENLPAVLGSHALTVDQSMRVDGMRDAARAFGEAIFDNVPDCTDRTMALRAMREALMWAVSAIANEPQAPTYPSGT